ncbi:hypothetical protein LguiB_010188 [Lonicera macranthoides]
MELNRSLRLQLLGFLLLNVFILSMAKTKIRTINWVVSTLWWHARSDWSRATVHGHRIIHPAKGTTYPFPKPPKEFPLFLGSWFKVDVQQLIEDTLASGGRPNTSNAFIINGQPVSIFEQWNLEIYCGVWKNLSSPYRKWSDERKYVLGGNYSVPSTIPFPNLPNYTDHAAAQNFVNRIRALASTEHPVNVPKMVYKRLLITISLNIAPCPNNTCTLGPNGNNTRLSPSLSNVSFHAPSIDLLQAYYRKIPGIFETDFPLEPPAFNFTADRTPHNALAPESATKVKVINFNSSVEIVFQGTNVLNSAENHPLHLHGYSFYVVSYGDGNFNNVTSPSTYNLVDPPEMNTVAVPRNGWAAVRFKADNPGPGRFQINLDEDHVRNFCDNLLMTGSRNEQYRLHKRFEKYSSTEEARQHAPPSLSQDNWNLLCAKFKDPHYQNRCVINKINRSKQMIPHNRGSRAFVAERHFLRDEVTGVEPDRIDFYKSTHWSSTKGWTCRATELNQAEMERLTSLAENQALMARIKALEAGRTADAEAHRVEKEAMLAREAKFDKLFDMLSASESWGHRPWIFTAGGDRGNAWIMNLLSHVTKGTRPMK